MIHLDFETFCEKNVKHIGAYRYAQDESCQIILAAYAFGNGLIHIWEYGDPPPKELNARIKSGEMIAAHNAEFEYAILKWCGKKSGFISAPAIQFFDTATQAAICTLPRSLDKATKALRIEHTKDQRGTRLINRFCMPRRPTKHNKSTRIYPQDAPKDWQAFIEYCMADVAAERALYKQLPKLSAEEHKAWRLTQKINERGIPLDLHAINAAGLFINDYQKKLNEKCLQLTNGISPTRVAKLTEWIGLPNLQKKTIQEALTNDTYNFTKAQKNVLNIRIESGRASTKKLQAMARTADIDGRARGTLLHYGARTGRWAGRIVQPQNFIRGNPKEQDLVFNLLFNNALDIYYEYPINAIAESMRGFICATKNHKLFVADYSAIEARVLAWLVGQEDVLALYHAGIDTYKDMAAFMFHTPIEEVTDKERYIGKQTVLGCGYQMGAERFYRQAQALGATDVTREMATHAVQSYRERYDKVVKFWYGIERSARKAFTKRKKIKCRYLEFDFTDDRFLTMRLPSGRLIYFYEPHLRKEYDRMVLYHTHYDNITNKESQRSLFGGLLTENAVQSIACCLMRNGMHNADEAGFRLIMTVHDEAIAEAIAEENGEKNIEEFKKELCRLPAWAQGIPLTAGGFICKRYRKD